MEQNPALSWWSAPTPGERHRLRRERRGLSKSRLARLAGCSRAAILKIETDKATPRVTLALTLCKALGATPELIWGKRPSP